jgi:ABC-type branched-subunit amino acid transport system substrate-binding protein
MAIPDNVFRLSVNDFRLSEVIDVMLDDRGYDSVVIIQRNDGWGDGIVNMFENLYTGTIIEKVRYPPETYKDFTQYLDEAESALRDYNGTGKPCVLLVSFNEAARLLLQLPEYPCLMNTTWFGTDGTVNSRQIEDEAGLEASIVRLYCPMQAPDPSNPWYQEINTEYKTQFEEDMPSREALTYDCCWLMAHCVIDANTTDGATILESILEVSRNHDGITGGLALDEDGDRANYSYAIYQYVEDNGMNNSQICGFYNGETGKIEWIK